MWLIFELLLGGLSSSGGDGDWKPLGGDRLSLRSAALWTLLALGLLALLVWLYSIL